MRKIIQVAVESNPGTTGDIIALCDDATLWKFNYISRTKTRGWTRYPPIPQDEGEEVQCRMLFEP